MQIRETKHSESLSRSDESMPNIKYQKLSLEAENKMHYL
jgi:hypothetical protein